MIKMDGTRELERLYIDDMVGESPAMQHVRELIRVVAPLDVTVLITGESGTGKELVARAIHSKSTRSSIDQFVVIDGSTISSQLAESTLFGHKKGAFTDARTNLVGRFEYANGCIVFLDEIGNMDLSVQAKLLRFLDTKMIYPVGSNEGKKLDVRVVAATNADLERAIREGRFREDLYYRLHKFPVYLPPLRERREDIPILVKHFIGLWGGIYGVNVKGVSGEVMEKFMRHPWKGNVRELEDSISYALILKKAELLEKPSSEPEVLGVEYFEGIFRSPNIGRQAEPNYQQSVLTGRPVAEKLSYGELVRYYRRCLLEDIQGVIAQHDGSVGKAADYLKTTPNTLHQLLSRAKRCGELPK